MKPYEIIKSETVFNGRFIRVDRDVLHSPDGGEMLREIVVSRQAAAIVAENDKGEIVLVKQYRHAVKKETLEIPAGLLEEGEEPIDCARRELAEETKFDAKEFTYITGLHTSIGFCTEVVHIFSARALTPDNTAAQDPDEFINCVFLSKDEIFRLIKDGEITDGKTITGILLHARNADGGA